MRILFITTQPYLPLFYGGTEISTHSIAKIFLNNGHHIAVLSSLANKKHNITEIYYRILAKAARNSITMDYKLGYPVYRCWISENKVKVVIHREEPDIVIIHSQNQNLIANSLINMGLPIVNYIRQLHFNYSLNILNSITFIANSNFTAQVFQSRTSKSAHVIPPIVIPELYRNPGPGKIVLLVNPIPKKGIDIALKLVERCPDIPFFFCRGMGIAQSFA